MTNSLNYVVNFTFTINVVPLPTASLTVVPTGAPPEAPSYPNNQILPFAAREITLRPVFNFVTATGTVTINNLSFLNGMLITSGGSYPVTPEAGATPYVLRVTNSLNYVVDFTFTINIQQRDHTGGPIRP